MAVTERKSNMNCLAKVTLSLIITIISFSSVHTANFTLTILHTNDVHARFEETNKYGSACTSADCYGGVARRFTKIQEIRSNHDSVILMDAGDQFQGTLWFNYYKGNATRYFMNLLGYDVMSFGNHEFDNDIEGLIAFLQNLSFPVVCSNINTEMPSFKSGFTASTILNVSGHQVGVVGYITEEMPSLNIGDGVSKLKFTSIIESVRSEVQRLTDEGVSIIIALGHAGYEADLQLAKEVTGLDLVVGGHTDTFLYNGEAPSTEPPMGPYPTIVVQDDGSLVPVVQDYTFGKYLGYLNLTFDKDGTVLSWSGNPILLDSSVQQDAAVLTKIEELKNPLKILMKQKVGEAHVMLDGSRTSCRAHECNLGNMATDAIIKFYLKKLPLSAGWTRASIAIWNSGAIRSTIPKGEVTMADIMTTFPFSNTIELMQVNGSTLLSILEFSVSSYNLVKLPGAFLQFSGIRVKFDLTRDAGERVTSVDVLCAECDIPSFSPLDPTHNYYIFINDYLIGGGDGYSVIKHNLLKRIPLDDLITDILLDYMSKYSPVTASVEGRIELRSGTVTAVTPTVQPSPSPVVFTRECPASAPAVIPTSTVTVLVMMTAWKIAVT